MKISKGILLFVIILTCCSCSKRKSINQEGSSRIQETEKDQEMGSLDSTVNSESEMNQNTYREEQMQLQARRNSNNANGGYLFEDDDCICYSKEAMQGETTKGQLVLMDKSTQKEKALAEDLVTHIVKFGDWVYYIKTESFTQDSAGPLYKVNVNTMEKKELLKDNVKELQIQEDCLFFTLCNSGEKKYTLYWMKSDETEPVRLTDMETRSINLMNHDIYYEKLDEKNEAYIYQLDLETAKESKVFETSVNADYPMIVTDRFLYYGSSEYDELMLCQRTLDGLLECTINTGCEYYAVDGDIIYTDKDELIKKLNRITHEIKYIGEETSPHIVMIYDWGQENVQLPVSTIWQAERSEHTWDQLAKIEEKKKNMDPMEVIQFQDPQLEQILRCAIGKKNGEVLLQDLDCITQMRLIEDSFEIRSYDQELASSEKNPEIEFSAYRIDDYSDLLSCRNLVCLDLYADRYQPVLRELYLYSTDIEYERIDYPYSIAKEDAQQGIYAGNYINNGTIAYDADSLYYHYSYWGDIPHPYFYRFHLASNKSSQMEVSDVEVMEGRPGFPDGDYHLFMNSINIYDGRLYCIYIGDDDSAQGSLIEDGFQGNKAYGICSMKLDGLDCKSITTKPYSSICIVNDMIYGITSDLKFYSLTLDGKKEKKLVKESCDFGFADDNLIYYIPSKSSGYLYAMNHDGTKKHVVIKDSVSSPIILDETIYYRKNNSIMKYDKGKKTSEAVLKEEVTCYNVKDQWLYYSNKSGIYRKNLKDGSVSCLRKAPASSIQVAGDSLFLDGIYFGWKMKNDGTEVVYHYSMN